MEERYSKSVEPEATTRATDESDGTVSQRALTGWYRAKRGFFFLEGLTADMLLVGLAFAAHADRSGRAWPGVARLQAMTRLGRDRIKRAKAELVRLGLLTKCRTKAGGGRFSGIRYVVSDAIAASETVSAHGTESRSCGKANGNTPDEPTSLHHRTENPSDGNSVRWNFSPQNKNKKSTSMSVQNESKRKSENQASKHPSRTDADADNFKGPRSKGKTLAEVLDIDKIRLRNKERVGMNILERQFRSDQPPLECEGLAEWLDARLEWMKGEGHVFPKVVLLRLKQLQRSRTIAPVKEGPETAENFQGTEPGELDKLRQLRDALRSGIWAFWESWTRPARAGTHAQKCRAFLEAAASKGVELTREEREVLERHANVMAKESPHDKE